MNIKKLAKLTLLLGLASCFSSKTPPLRQVASTHQYQPQIEQGEIWGAPEEQALDEIASIFRDTLIDATGNNPLMRRDAHPKHHGCVATTLEIANQQLPQEYRLGLFANNQSYRGVIRFSNGDPNHQKADIESDVRGMAIKLLNVPYQNYLQESGLEDSDNIHDLVFMNADEFFIPNPKEYQKFMRATQGRFGVLSYLAFRWGTLRNILQARVKITNPLDVDYASATPYKLGDTSMKMKFVSCRNEDQKDQLPKNPTPNFLSERLEKSLAENEQCFDFYIQPNKDKKKNNIENAMLHWNEKKSPMIKVGKLVIEKQSGFRSKERMQACENMSFNPWRAPEVNRPLGGVNRIRLDVYLKQSKLRREHNHIEIRDGI